MSHTLTALVGKQRFERANLLRVRGGVRVRVRFDRESLLGVEVGLGFRSGSGLWDQGWGWAQGEGCRVVGRRGHIAVRVRVAGL